MSGQAVHKPTINLEKLEQAKEGAKKVDWGLLAAGIMVTKPGQIAVLGVIGAAGVGIYTAAKAISAVVSAIPSATLAAGAAAALAYGAVKGYEAWERRQTPEHKAAQKYKNAVDEIDIELQVKAREDRQTYDHFYRNEAVQFYKGFDSLAAEQYKAKTALGDDYINSPIHKEMLSAEAIWSAFKEGRWANSPDPAQKELELQDAKALLTHTQAPQSPAPGIDMIAKASALGGQFDKLTGGKYGLAEHEQQLETQRLAKPTA